MGTSEMIRVYDGVPVPYSEGQFRMDIQPARAPKGRLSDEFLAEFDVYRPRHTPEPIPPAGQIAVENDLPTLIDGVWTYEWTVRPRNEQEIASYRAELTVPRDDFAVAVMVSDIIPPQDAQDWASGTALPAAVETALVAAITDPTQLAVAKIKALSSANIGRTNPLIGVLADTFEMTPEEVDSIFETAKQIGGQA